uniref:Putative secreted protein n=2 Tax=Ixodes ricinus TaxID=34613 RepID=V5ID44_IXORI
MGPLALRLLLAVVVSLQGRVDAAAQNGLQWLGDACDDDGDCNGALNLHCDKRRQCTCKSGYVSVQFGCQRASLLGQACSFPSQCQYYDAHSFCDKSGRCSCLEGFKTGPHNAKCSLTPLAPERNSLQKSLSTGAVFFGLFSIIITGIICVVYLVKCIMSNPPQPQPQPRPRRKSSRKHTHLKMNYFKAIPATQGEKKALLHEVKQPPSYLEATRVPQIIITDYSTIPKSTTTYTSA